MGTSKQKPNTPSTGFLRRRPSPGMLSLCSGLILVLLVGFVFSPCLTAELLVEHDDGHYIYEKGRVWGASWRDVAGTFGRFYFPAETGGYYQPLTNMSYMLDAKIIGRDWEARSFQFHFSNLILHLLNVAILFILLRRLSGSTGWAFLLAAFFGLHPLQVTSVAWVSQRMTVLGTFFALLAISAYLRYAATEGLRWFFLVIFLTAAAMLAKPTFLALPVVFLVLDIWPVRRGVGAARTVTVSTPHGAWRPVIEKLPLFLLMLWAAALHMWLHTRVEPLGGTAIGGVSLVAMNVASLALRMVFPYQLTSFHPISEVVSAGLTDRHVLTGGILIVVFGVLMIRFLKRNKPGFVALAGTSVLILPAFMDLPYTTELLGDQHLYAAFLLPLIAVAGWIRTQDHLLSHGWARCLALAVSSIVLLFAVRSFGQCFVWHDSRALYTQAIKEYPEWPDGYVGVVKSYLQDHDYDAALQSAERATEIAPDEPETQFILGKVLLLHEDGRCQEAIIPLRKALDSNPNWIECLKLLGSALVTTGQLDEAQVFLERARDLSPKSPQVRTLLGEVYLQTGRPSSARAEFQLALKEVSTPEAHLGLARAWAMNDRPDFACRHLTVAVRLDPRFSAYAAQFPELLRLRDQAGFEKLLDVSGDSATGTVTPMTALPGSLEPGAIERTPMNKPPVAPRETAGDDIEKAPPPVPATDTLGA